MTDALWDKVRREAQAQVKACAAAGPKMDLKRCPRSMALRNDWGTLRVTQMPQIDTLQSFQNDYHGRSGRRCAAVELPQRTR